MNRHPHILTASTNLLGICFVIIGGLKLTGRNPLSYSDEVAWVAAVLLFTSILASYWVIREHGSAAWQSAVAEAAFLAGIAALMTSVLIGAAVL